MNGKTWRLPGGVHPPENKLRSLQLPLAQLPLPDIIILPLSQHIGAPARAVIETGQPVLRGEVVAAASGPMSVPVHASTSGRVIAIEERPIIHASGMSAPCIVIEPDGEDKWTERIACDDYKALSNEMLLEKIRNAGIAGMGGAGFPTAVKLNARRPIDTLIINGTECEPYITADDYLMQTRADEVVAGAEILAHLLGQPQRMVIGVEDNKPNAIAALQQASVGSALEVVSFPTKYPSGGEKQLIHILTGREVPSGGLPAQIGVVCQNVGTTVAIYRAIRHGEPLTSRYTTVVGDALSTERNVEIRLGTPIQHLLNHHDFRPERASRVVIGGPMMGFAVSDLEAPLVKTSNCVLAPSEEELPTPPVADACIRCGMCAEVCPISLMPQQLYWYSQSEDFERLQAHNLFDCIECGACSYVCPSNIPLVQYYRSSKGALRKMQDEKRKSDYSRQRFEARQARLEAEEAEKLAKKEARKKAAADKKKAKSGSATAVATSDSATSANEQVENT